MPGLPSVEITEVDFVIRTHALAMLQNAPADPLAALEEKHRSKMLQQHAAAIGSKETTKTSRRIWSFVGEGQGSGKQSFVGYFVSLSVCQPSSCQVDKKMQKVKSSELQEDLPAMCTQDIYEEDAELDCDLPAFWF